jgi:hypothetical protein
MAGFNLKDLRDMIPEYDRDQSTLFDFIEAVNFAIENVPENQQNALIFIIKSKLVGKARKFISSRQLREWNDIKGLLINHYGDCRDTEALNNELNQAARNALNSSHEKIALKAFLAGLSDPLGSIIRSQKPNTLEQAEQFLIEEENIIYLKNFKILKPSHNQVNHKIVPKENYPSHCSTTRSDKKYCSYCKKSGHLVDRCFQRNQNQVNQNIQQPNQQRPSVTQHGRNENSNVDH